MASGSTQVFEFVLPEVGAEADNWGTLLNGNWEDLDALLKGFFTTTPGVFSRQGNASSVDISGGANDCARLTLYGSNHSSFADYAILEGDNILLRNVAGSPFLTLTNNDFKVTQVYSQTTGASANVNIQASGRFLRSTSSKRSKRAINSLNEDEFLAILELNPVSYYSTAAADDPNELFYSFVAEEVDEVSSTFVFHDEEGNADGLNINAIVAALTALVQHQYKLIADLEERVINLEG